MKIHCGPRKVKTTLTFIGLTFGTSLLYLSKHFCNPRLKNLIIGNSLIQLPIAYHVLSVSFNRASVIMNLKDSVTNNLFTIEVLHVTNKICELSREIHFKLLWIYGPEETAYLDTFHSVPCHQNGK